MTKSQKQSDNDRFAPTELWGVRNDDGWVRADSGNDFKTDKWKVAFSVLEKLLQDGARGIRIVRYTAENDTQK